MPGVKRRNHDRFTIGVMDFSGSIPSSKGSGSTSVAEMTASSAHVWDASTGVNHLATLHAVTTAGGPSWLPYRARFHYRRTPPIGGLLPHRRPAPDPARFEHRLPCLDRVMPQHPSARHRFGWPGGYPSVGPYSHPLRMSGRCVGRELKFSCLQGCGLVSLLLLCKGRISI